MEERPAAGPASSSRFRHHRSAPSPDRVLSMLPQQMNPPSPTPALELSEDDIFSTPSGSSSPSPTRQYIYPNASPARSPNCNHYGILAALNANLKARSRSGSGYDNIRPVFNHKASVSASVFSSSSVSPPATTSSRVMIPRPPPQPDRRRFYHHSAPVNIPVMPAELQRRIRELEEVASVDAEEDGMIKPPHEVVASRHSPLLACSVLEGAGRTLKGRDHRQVRNAIWRKTGFID